MELRSEYMKFSIPKTQVNSSEEPMMRLFRRASKITNVPAYDKLEPSKDQNEKLTSDGSDAAIRAQVSKGVEQSKSKEVQEKQEIKNSTYAKGANEWREGPEEIKQSGLTEASPNAPRETTPNEARNQISRTPMSENTLYAKNSPTNNMSENTQQHYGRGEPLDRSSKENRQEDNRFANAMQSHGGATASEQDHARVPGAYWERSAMPVITPEQTMAQSRSPDHAESGEGRGHVRGYGEHRTPVTQWERPQNMHANADRRRYTRKSDASSDSQSRSSSSSYDSHGSYSRATRTRIVYHPLPVSGNMIIDSVSAAPVHSGAAEGTVSMHVRGEHVSPKQPQGYTNGRLHSGYVSQTVGTATRNHASGDSSSSSSHSADSRHSKAGHGGQARYDHANGRYEYAGSASGSGNGRYDYGAHAGRYDGPRVRPDDRAGEVHMGPRTEKPGMLSEDFNRMEMDYYQINRYGKYDQRAPRSYAEAYDHKMVEPKINYGSYKHERGKVSPQRKKIKNEYAHNMYQYGINHQQQYMNQYITYQNMNYQNYGNMNHYGHKHGEYQHGGERHQMQGGHASHQYKQGMRAEHGKYYRDQYYTSPANRNDQYMGYAHYQNVHYANMLDQGGYKNYKMPPQKVTSYTHAPKQIKPRQSSALQILNPDTGEVVNSTKADAKGASSKGATAGAAAVGGSAPAEGVESVAVGAGDRGVTSGTAAAADVATESSAPGESATEVAGSVGQGTAKAAAESVASVSGEVAVSVSTVEAHSSAAADVSETNAEPKATVASESVVSSTSGEREDAEYVSAAERSLKDSSGEEVEGKYQVSCAQEVATANVDSAGVDVESTVVGAGIDSKVVRADVESTVVGVDNNAYVVSSSLDNRVIVDSNTGFESVAAHENAVVGGVTVVTKDISALNEFGSAGMEYEKYQHDNGHTPSKEITQNEENTRKEVESQKQVDTQKEPGAQKEGSVTKEWKAQKELESQKDSDSQKEYTRREKDTHKEASTEEDEAEERSKSEEYKKMEEVLSPINVLKYAQKKQSQPLVNNMSQLPSMHISKTRLRIVNRPINPSEKLYTLSELHPYKEAFVYKEHSKSHQRKIKNKPLNEIGYIEEINGVVDSKLFDHKLMGPKMLDHKLMDSRIIDANFNGKMVDAKMIDANLGGKMIDANLAGKMIDANLAGKFVDAKLDSNLDGKLSDAKKESMVTVDMGTSTELSDLILENSDSGSDSNKSRSQEHTDNESNRNGVADKTGVMATQYKAVETKGEREQVQRDKESDRVQQGPKYQFDTRVPVKTASGTVGATLVSSMGGFGAATGAKSVYGSAAASTVAPAVASTRSGATKGLTSADSVARTEAETGSIGAAGTAQTGTPPLSTTVTVATTSATATIPSSAPSARTTTATSATTVTTAKATVATQTAIGHRATSTVAAPSTTSHVATPLTTSHVATPLTTMTPITVATVATGATTTTTRTISTGTTSHGLMKLVPTAEDDPADPSKFSTIKMIYMGQELRRIGLQRDRAMGRFKLVPLNYTMGSSTGSHASQGGLQSHTSFSEGYTTNTNTRRKTKKESKWRSELSIEKEELTSNKPKKPTLSKKEQFKRSVRTLLNKLTVENFLVVSEKIATLYREAEEQESVRVVVDLLHEKATHELEYSDMYADLAFLLKYSFNEKLDLGSKTTCFHKTLLNKCQDSFEEISTNHGLDKTYILGNIRFMGELFLRKILSITILKRISCTLMTSNGNNVGANSVGNCGSGNNVGANSVGNCGSGNISGAGVGNDAIATSKVDATAELDAIVCAAGSDGNVGGDSEVAGSSEKVAAEAVSGSDDARSSSISGSIDGASDATGIAGATATSSATTVTAATITTISGITTTRPAPTSSATTTTTTTTRTNSSTTSSADERTDRSSSEGVEATESASRRAGEGADNEGGATAASAGSSGRSSSASDDMEFRPPANLIECFSELLTTIGYTVDQIPGGSDMLDEYLAILISLKKRGIYPTRINFKIQDLIDLRNRNWRKKLFKEKATSVSQIHRLAEQEQLRGGPQEGRFVTAGLQTNRHYTPHLLKRRQQVVDSLVNGVYTQESAQRLRESGGAEGRSDDSFYPQVLKLFAAAPDREAFQKEWRSYRPSDDSVAHAFDQMLKSTMTAKTLELCLAHADLLSLTLAKLVDSETLRAKLLNTLCEYYVVNLQEEVIDNPWAMDIASRTLTLLFNDFAGEARNLLEKIPIPKHFPTAKQLVINIVNGTRELGGDLGFTRRVIRRHLYSTFHNENLLFLDEI
ncbi:uncharacterized protein TOT_010000576 [Theileria orientalis strain Shintoku]|uniref:MIF4G domain-containing protein n=1 Tax=Theileria orientalis strain Shintoku TaxID=869250 RepID=J4DNK4_THEOR|nr:uncharacterized protein TOT_010000576 [Theileria orientalis strain Shintoku]BAM39114.1 uncharacterized protein TOT_010000576 [Theileria orientalis strain Shintoku]|eukprot:XP_009689415.1 uncharacterized protein TOT_010000576 [Theileria orientalis strain Shintoku]